jgi:hypothetical protein
MSLVVVPDHHASSGLVIQKPSSAIASIASPSSRARVETRATTASRTDGVGSWIR